MSQFLFQGDFVRKPTQTLGGSSRTSEQRDTVLQKAEVERRRRERHRQEQAALLKLQAFFRGCLERKRIRLMGIQEFDSKRRMELTNAELIRQIYLLNSFFRFNDEDIQRFLELGKLILTRSAVVISFIKMDNAGAFAIKQILQKCLQCLNTPNVPPAILLRLIETYTDPQKYEDSQSNILSDQSVEIVSNMWLFMIEEADLFMSYRKFLESKLPPMRNPTEINRITQSYDYLLVYKRIMSIRSLLKTRKVQLFVRRRKYDADDAIELIMSKFADSFSENVIPLEGNNGIAAYYIIPRLTNCVPWDDWVRIIRLSTLGKVNPDGIRQTLYVTLAFMNSMDMQEADIGKWIRAVRCLQNAIDPRYRPAQLSYGLARHIDERDEDMDEDEDEDMGGHVFKNEEDKCYKECRIIYTALARLMNASPIATWLCPFQLKNWEIMSDVISCIVRLEPKLSSIDFFSLSTLSYRRDFMRSLCLHCMTETALADNNILAFCWLFSHLLGTLHDAEFLAGIPIQKEELSKLIVMLRERYCYKILTDAEWSDSSVTGTMKAITSVIMSLHDRNSRLTLFSEDIFISSTLTKICPVETHSLRFAFVTAEEHVEDLPPMEDKLLKILRDYPFALSFHDRVKVWNRLLDLDKQVHDPNPMAHREDIQVRRNFIYEDAFEKLSPENVPDLRRHIRISLVNVVGVMEAGIDGGGLLREFLTEATKAAVDPNRGLFRFDSQNRIYPNPVAKKLMSNFRKHFFVVGRLVGKALFEQTLLELPMAAFFIQYSIEGKVNSAVDFLATLDPGLHKNLLALKTFKGDLNNLGLDFTLAVEELGETRIIELKPDGSNISVDQTNVIEYIHLVADYKINKEMEDECRSFRAGMMDVVPSLRMFSWRELQTLISGSDKPIDVDDWRANTNYGPGFSDDNETMQMFWQVVKSFDEKCLRMLLKFVTSCSRPPLLGFKDLIPKFGIQSAGKTDRLPTAATCMNLLKLPEFENVTTMKEKLLYVINAHAGFELS